jgi:hypothetical protein
VHGESDAGCLVAAESRRRGSARHRRQRSLKVGAGISLAGEPGPGSSRSSSRRTRVGVYGLRRSAKRSPLRRRE